MAGRYNEMGKQMAGRTIKGRVVGRVKAKGQTETECRLELDRRLSAKAEDCAELFGSKKTVWFLNGRGV